MATRSRVGVPNPWDPSKRGFDEVCTESWGRFAVRGRRVGLFD